MNVDEMSKKTGMHKNTIYKLIKEGGIKATKNGKSYTVEEQEVEMFLRGKIPFMKEQELINSTNLLINEIEEHQKNEILKVAYLGNVLFTKIKNIAERKQKGEITEEEFNKAILEIKKESVFNKIFNGVTKISNDEATLFNLDSVKNVNEVNQINITSEEFLGWCKNE